MILFLNQIWQCRPMYVWDRTEVTRFACRFRSVSYRLSTSILTGGWGLIGSLDDIIEWHRQCCQHMHRAMPAWRYCISPHKPGVCSSTSPQTAKDYNHGDARNKQQSVVRKRTSNWADGHQWNSDHHNNIIEYIVVLFCGRATLICMKIRTLERVTVVIFCQRQDTVNPCSDPKRCH